MNIETVQSIIKQLDSYDEEGFHLFRSPDEPGFIEGATTFAGNLPVDWYWVTLTKEGVSEVNRAVAIEKIIRDEVEDVLSQIGLFLNGRDIYGKCGTVLYCNPTELVMELSQRIWEREINSC